MSASFIGRTWMAPAGPDPDTGSAAPPAGVDPPLLRRAIAGDGAHRVDQVDDWTDMVRDDGDDLAERRPASARRHGDDAVVVVDPLDHEVGIAEDRAVALAPRRAVLRERLGPGVDDETVVEGRHDGRRN